MMKIKGHVKVFKFLSKRSYLYVALGVINFWIKSIVFYHFIHIFVFISKLLLTLWKKPRWLIMNKAALRSWLYVPRIVLLFSNICSTFETFLHQSIIFTLSLTLTNFWYSIKIEDFCLFRMLIIFWENIA
jgi:hypothetical protein